MRAQVVVSIFSLRFSLKENRRQPLISRSPRYIVQSFGFSPSRLTKDGSAKDRSEYRQAAGAIAQDLRPRNPT